MEFSATFTQGLANLRSKKQYLSAIKYNTDRVHRLNANAFPICKADLCHGVLDKHSGVTQRVCLSQVQEQAGSCCRTRRQRPLAHSRPALLQSIRPAVTRRQLPTHRRHLPPTHGRTPSAPFSAAPQPPSTPTMPPCNSSSRCARALE